MKKFLQNTLARALCVLLIGILLIVYAGQITTWIVMASGLLFIIPGLVSLIGFFRHDNDGRRLMLYPLLFTGCILFGLVLIIWPMLFLKAIVYILSALLLVAASTQFYTLWSLHHGGVRVHAALYAIPALELIAGLYVMLTNNKAEIASLPVIFTGIGFIIYALIELWTIYLVRQHRPYDSAKEITAR